MMKKLTIAALILFLAASVIFAQQQRFRNGNVTAQGVSYNEATGMANGSLTVRVTFRGNRITEIVVTEHTDSAPFLAMASSQVIPAIIRAQSTEVDNVSGATWTSIGIREAVAAAMAQARR